MNIPAPLTVTDAVAYLRAQGYTDDIELKGTNFVSSVQTSPTH